MEDFFEELLEENLEIVVFVGSMGYLLSWFIVELTLLKDLPSSIKALSDTLFSVYCMVSVVWAFL